MRIVAALGGNALLRRGEPMTAEAQRRNARIAAQALAPLVRDGHELIVTHGNGPQVGLIALQAAAGPEDGRYTLDILGAESEGMVGYLIVQELRNALPAGSEAAALLTQVRVDPQDPAFARPTKPIGPLYDTDEARRVAAARQWRMAPDGDRFRRVVPSPAPVEILEANVIALLAARGVTLVCVGGGGIPVVRHADGALRGVEAVIDKDRASALLASQLEADRLLLLTDVDAVYRGWGSENATPIAAIDPQALDPTAFEEGTMRPKVEAAARFADRAGRAAGIGSLSEAAEILAGRRGTTIARDPGR